MKDTPKRYQWSYNGVEFDFYRLCDILDIKSHAQAHALKKVIRAGKSIKDIKQDIDESIDSLGRWKEMIMEDEESTTKELNDQKKEILTSGVLDNQTL